MLFTVILFACLDIARCADSVIAEMMTAHTAQVSYMEDQARLDTIVWGRETNGVRVGLVGGNPRFSSLDAGQEFIGVVLKNNTTNELRFVVPKIPRQFDLAVFDDQGNPVDRTSKGRSIGEAIPAVRTFTRGELIHNEYDNQTRKRAFLPPAWPELFTCVNLLDYFKITKPGKYRVEYEQRFQSFPDSSVQSTNKLPSLVGLVWPKATITIEVH